MSSPGSSDLKQSSAGWQDFTEGSPEAREELGGRASARRRLPMTRNRIAPIAVPAIPKITWKAAMGKPIARTNSVATHHTAKKWSGKAPTSDVRDQGEEVRFTMAQPCLGRSSSGGLRRTVGWRLVFCNTMNAAVPHRAGTHNEIAW